jgi:uncharacterized Rmd1/YagE family protein
VEFFTDIRCALLICFHGFIAALRKEFEMDARYNVLDRKLDIINEDAR